MEGNLLGIIFPFHRSSVIIPKSLIGTVEASGVFMVTGKVGIFFLSSETVECLCANTVMKMCRFMFLQTHSYVFCLPYSCRDTVWF